MDVLDRSIGKLCLALVSLACALLFGMMLVICVDVFLRNVAVPGMPRGFALASDLSESAIYLMTLLVAPYLLRSGRHIRIDLLLHMVPARIGWLMELLAACAMLVCCLAIVWYGFIVTARSAGGNAMLIKTVVYPEWWILVPLPCVFVLLSLEAIFRLRSLIDGPRQPRHEQVSVS
ncbi:TRAP transporter small permease subunit [Bradyrhizobium sp. AUGA SZCCT0169]|jgi:TRAP-type C4-dicarboxylate transport system permease small subunit|uniref:TRAP transporter small permease n=1 Tax=Bradyrhizobium sp. AUGA SZCCT0169 TaxID=2807663 RepID=UPI001BA53EAD|nr:TRAP transporter small permease subunit [Bradyrhizobium sp. AUGA SZCCT0169]MBR1251500.1 TRAP transporter small permease subunit [Bradyrhizobium sp. AUGA SZCCT0169]